MRLKNQYAAQVDKTPLWIRATVGAISFLFGMGFLLNVYIIVNGFLKENGLPSAFGITPVVVIAGEEEGVVDLVESGDFLLIVEKDMDSYRVGDPIAFCVNETVLLGRISGQESDRDGDPAFSVRAVFLQQSYAASATEHNMLGTMAVRIPLLGYFVLFLTSLPGRLIFVGIPLLVYMILLLIELLRIKQTEKTEKEIGGKAAVGVYARALREGRAYLSAPWIWLVTSLLTWSAIGYGTADARKDERLAKKRETEFVLKERVASVFPNVGQRELPSCRPVRMHANRAIRPGPRRSVRAIQPQVPRNVQRIDP